MHGTDGPTFTGLSNPRGGNSVTVHEAADILPHELKGPVQGMMQQGMDAMKKQLEAA